MDLKKILLIFAALATFIFLIYKLHTKKEKYELDTDIPLQYIIYEDFTSDKPIYVRIEEYRAKERFELSKYKTINGFKVLKSFTDREIAADLIEEINRRNKTLINFLFENRNSFPSDIKNGITLLKKRYREQNIKEVSPNNKEHLTAYMEGKGRIYGLCLRKKDGDFVDINTLMFVNLHELAHLMIKDFRPHHDDEFYKKYKFLINVSIKLGIYKDHDYERYPREYCGLIIQTNV